MATKQEIEKELNIALKEIGDIVPWYDKRFKMWIFSHPLYPVEYAGDSVEEVIENYPLYLKELIIHRLKGQLNPVTEKETLGRAGKRTAAGRPRDTEKEPEVRLSLPFDIAEWIRQKTHWPAVRKLIHSK